MVEHLRAEDIARLRAQPGRAAGLFITDRCPVGCAHCSVDSRRNSPTITDFELFNELLVGLASQQALELVAITGGEPLVERRGVEIAARVLKQANKRLVLFTSGIWARREVAEWVRKLLRQVDTVFLSTDRYHENTVNRQVFVKAARAIAEAGCWIVVQTLDRREDAQRATYLLTEALGSSYSDYAEVVASRPLAYGRAVGLFDVKDDAVRAQRFGACGLLGSQLVRYDGRVTACCNEQVIMGYGSQRLARTCATSEELGNALLEFKSDPLFRLVRSLGFEALLLHPAFTALGLSHENICRLCWAANDLLRNSVSPDDPLLYALATLGSEQETAIES